jgi:hypothetical protein
MAARSQQASGSTARVSVGGARLDDDIAGERVLSAERKAEDEILFDAGVKLMRKGEYKVSS